MTKHNSQLLLRQAPSLDAAPVHTSICPEHEAWKRRLYADTHAMTGNSMAETHATFGFIYIAAGGLRICDDSALYGWKEKGNRKDGMTWVKISKNYDVWAPLPHFTPRVYKCSKCGEEGHNRRTCKLVGAR